MDFFLASPNEGRPFGVTPRDGAMMYHETDFSQLIVEPYNAFSSLAIALPVIYWLYYLRKDYKRYPFLVACMPLLFIGGMGSLLFHAFRASRWLLIMDWLPIALLVLMVSLFVWFKVVNKMWLAVLIVLSLSVLRFVVPFSFNLRGHTAINWSYFIGGVTMFLPILILTIRTNAYELELLVLSIFFFALALFFRYYDTLPNQFLPMGTHWLWHICCGLGIMPLSFYIKHLSELKVVEA